MSNTPNIDSSDITSTVLNIPTVIAFLGDVAVHWIPAFAVLEAYTEWYTKGVGAIVVTVNAYILLQKVRNNKKSQEQE